MLATIAMVVWVAQTNVAEDTAPDRPPYKSIVDAQSADELSVVRDLLSESYSVLRSPEFRANLLMLGSRYPVIYARPDKQDASVADVAKDVGVEPLGSRYAPVVVQVIGRNDRRDPLGIHASAGEGVGLGRYSEMTLGRYFLDQFRSADIVERSCALNAAAHEFAHTITLTPIGFRNAFTDTQINQSRIPDRRFPGTPVASYLIGAVAQCTWLQRKGRIDDAGLASCVEVFGVDSFAGDRCTSFSRGEPVALRPGLPTRPQPL